MELGALREKLAVPKQQASQVHVACGLVASAAPGQPFQKSGLFLTSSSIGGKANIFFSYIKPFSPLCLNSFPSCLNYFFFWNKHLL